METKLNLNSETVDVLEQLVQANIDSFEGYRDASESIENREITRLFEQLSAKRARHAEELKQFIRLNNERSPQEGTWLGAVHRSWLKARAALNGGDEQVVLIEASRGEDHIKEMYEDLLEKNPGSAVSQTLHQQYSSIVNDAKSIEALKEVYS